MRKSIIKILIYGLLLTSLDARLLGITITVTSSADSGAGSLRNALAAANPGDEIIFNVPGGTIFLTSDALVINDPITITGPIIIDGQNMVDIGFQINFAGSGTIIRNLTLQNFQGANGVDGAPATPGGDAIGIFINGASDCIIDTVTFSGQFIGGNGATGIAPFPGTDGGLAAAIRILDGQNNLIFSCILNGTFRGGNGGNASASQSSALTGGNGGRAGGIIIDNSDNNEMSTNQISIMLFGGNGGNGGDHDAVIPAGNGGIGGKAAGIIIDQSSSNNRLFDTNIQVVSTGGNGGNGGNNLSLGDGGVGGNGGDAANLIIDGQSNGNGIQENRFPLGTFTAGIGGAGGTPNGTAGIAGIIANVLVTNNSISNFILTNYIEGTASIFGIELFNGGNNEQEDPILTSAEFCPTTRQMFVSGQLSGTELGAQYLIQFFNNAPSVDINQGRNFIGQITIIGNGAVVNFADSFIVPGSTAVANGDAISSTATLGGLAAPTDTSEFSNNVNVTQLIPATANDAQFEICQSQILNQTLTGSSPNFAITSGPSNGIAVIINPITGAFTYTPNPGFSGVDSFQFIAGVGMQCPSLPATVTITVIPNIIARDHNFIACLDQRLNILSPGLLENTQILPIDQPIIVELVSAPSFGTVILRQDGSFVYTPRSGFIGQDSFSFRIIPGPNSPCGPSNEAIVNIQVKQCCSI